MTDRSDERDEFHRALTGDDEAVRAFVRRHGDSLYRCAIRLLNDTELASDVVQDVFVRALQSGAKFEHRSELGTWLHAIAINRCRDLQRARRSHDLQPLADAQRVPDGAPNAYEQIARRERTSQVQCSIANLPREMRELLALRFDAGKSYDDIATVLGCPSGTVASRLHRALQRLGSELRASGFDGETI